MENYVVIDLEMCKVPKKSRTVDFHWATETIQIGAVKLNTEYEVIDEFTIFVTPRFGRLTSDISRLTGITKEDLEGAPDIEEALRQFYDWLPENPVMVAWSDTDRSQMRYEIKGKHLSDDRLLNYTWVDCQQIFDKKAGAENNYSLLNALNLSDIDYREGIHNGLVDAYNTALLFAKLKKTPDYEFNKYYKSVDESDKEPEHLSTSMGNLLAGFTFPE